MVFAGIDRDGKDLRCLIQTRNHTANFSSTGTAVWEWEVCGDAFCYSTGENI